MQNYLKVIAWTEYAIPDIW